jgi:hypothetical protein
VLTTREEKDGVDKSKKRAGKPLELNVELG